MMKEKVFHSFLLVPSIDLSNILAQASLRVQQLDEIVKQEDFRNGETIDLHCKANG